MLFMCCGFLAFGEKKKNCYQAFDVSVNFRRKMADSGSAPSQAS